MSYTAALLGVKIVKIHTQSTMDTNSTTIPEDDDVTMTSVEEKSGILKDHDDMIAADQSESGGVQFRSRNSIEEVQRISRISNYNLEEVVNCWGDSNDRKLRKQELRQAALDMQHTRRMSDNTSFTTLGIADKVGEGRLLKKQNRKTATTAVLDEQDLQVHEGMYDAKLLSDVYSVTTVAAKKAAKESAEALHDEVRKF